MNDETLPHGTSLLSDDELDAALAVQTAPRVTQAMIEGRITKVGYTVIPDTTVTICHILLDNGRSVRGESACVDPANFNAAIGRTLAYKDAFDRLWPLFGFKMVEERFLAAEADCDARVDPALAPYQQRVVREKFELDRKLSALTGFLESEQFHGLPEAERGRMASQHVAMVAYSGTLAERIEAFAPA